MIRLSLPLRAVLFSTVCGLVPAASVHAANFTISTATALFVPGIRGQANTTYFGWTAGGWDGNADAAPGDAAIPDTLNSTPPVVGPGSSNTASLVQNNVTDIVSSSNNLYGGVSQFNLTLHIPTAGISATGSTTIILQGLGLSGSAFGGSAGGMDTFVFGDINGISPTYTGGANTGGNFNGQTQFWAEYHIPGNLPSYDLSVHASGIGEGVVSVTDFSVDTWYSPSPGTYSTDVVSVPESGGALLSASAMGLALARRRREASPSA